MIAAATEHFHLLFLFDFGTDLPTSSFYRRLECIVCGSNAQAHCDRKWDQIVTHVEAHYEVCSRNVACLLVLLREVGER